MSIVYRQSVVMKTRRQIGCSPERSRCWDDSGHFLPLPLRNCCGEWLVVAAGGNSVINLSGFCFCRSNQGGTTSISLVPLRDGAFYMKEESAC